MPRLSLLDDVRIGAQSLGASVSDALIPSLRIGVTGLSRAGKTVFLTALLHQLLHEGRLPALKAHRSGRLIGARLSPQPDDDVARFALEEHLHKLIHERAWPQSTRQISELRLTLSFEPESRLARTLGRTRLHLDLVDYPGEWLLDLPLLDMSFEAFSKDALAKARAPERAPMAEPFLKALADRDAGPPLSEEDAAELAGLYMDYLRACKEGHRALSMLPPGRFLMPGDLEGSPALTFAPMLWERDSRPANGSLYQAMERRYEAYKRVVVKPFFLDHFARLDRQIVLVDVLSAINAGSAALHDLSDALTAILSCFKAGRNTLLSSLFSPRIDKIAFVATKADHLHHSQHDRLEDILEELVADARQRAKFSGAKVETLAVSSVRATREASTRSGSAGLKAVAGVPIEGETINGETFDGEREVAIFPGDLPTEPGALLTQHAPANTLRFVRFRPPKRNEDSEKGERPPTLPHIRLDRLLEFLLGDKLA
ncbi:MAG: YcjX family protein [Pseudomonadota bacterium]